MSKKDEKIITLTVEEAKIALESLNFTIYATKSFDFAYRCADTRNRLEKQIDKAEGKE